MGSINLTFTVTMPGFTKRAADKFNADEIIKDIKLGLVTKDWLVDNIEEFRYSREYFGEDDSRYVVVPVGTGYEYVVRDNERDMIFAGPTNSFDAQAVADLMNDRNEEL